MNLNSNIKSERVMKSQQAVVTLLLSFLFGYTSRLLSAAEWLSTRSILLWLLIPFLWKQPADVGIICLAEEGGVETRPNWCGETVGLRKGEVARGDPDLSWIVWCRGINLFDDAIWYRALIMEVETLVVYVQGDGCFARCRLGVIPTALIVLNLWLLLLPPRIDLDSSSFFAINRRNGLVLQ